MKGYPFEVAPPPEIEAEGAILSDQIESLDWRVCMVNQVGRLPTEVLEETFARLLTLVDAKEAR